MVRFQPASVCSEVWQNWCVSVHYSFAPPAQHWQPSWVVGACIDDAVCVPSAADSGDFDSIIKTVTSAGVVPLESAVAQRAKGQILPLGVGGGGGPTGIGNYGSGGFGGGRGGGTSAASAMDVEQVPAPAAGSGLGHGPGGGQWAEQIANLTAMGFDREAVAAVLEATQGNVEQAIQILTS